MAMLGAQRSALRVESPNRGRLARSKVTIKPTARGRVLAEEALAQRREAEMREEVANDVGLRAARADRDTLRAGGWVVGGRPVGGGFLDQRAAASSVHKFGALAEIHSRASMGGGFRRGSDGQRPHSTSPEHGRRGGRQHSRQGRRQQQQEQEQRAQFANLLDRPTFVEPSWRESMLHQMRNPKPHRMPRLEPEPELEPLEVAEQTRAVIRKEERIAVVKHALQKGRDIREKHKMKNAAAFSSLEELEKYEAIAREARPKLEARMKALAERDETLDPQNIMHRKNPAGAKATLMAMAYDEAAEEWEAECRAVQKRMRRVLSQRCARERWTDSGPPEPTSRLPL
jgi:hypothetical protein